MTFEQIEKYKSSNWFKDINKEELQLLLNPKNDTRIIYRHLTVSASCFIINMFRFLREALFAFFRRKYTYENKRTHSCVFITYRFICRNISPTASGVLKNIKLGLDLQGGFEVLYQVEELKKGQEITEEVVADTASALSSRVDALGVNEPSIQIEDGNRIRVQLAGVEDQNAAREMLSTKQI